jgi:hypothetical protein
VGGSGGVGCGGLPGATLGWGAVGVSSSGAAPAAAAAGSWVRARGATGHVLAARACARAAARDAPGAELPDGPACGPSGAPDAIRAVAASGDPGRAVAAGPPACALAAPCSGRVPAAGACDRALAAVAGPALAVATSGPALAVAACGVAAATVSGPAPIVTVMGWPPAPGAA